VLHCRGVRQGDPLPPMLFLLAMEHLHRLFRKAQEDNLLSKVSKGCDTFRVFLYADDAIVFIKPTKKDLMITHCILDTFAEASDLITNMKKTQFYLIQCSHLNLDFLTQNNHAITSFPCCYLGLPLHFKMILRTCLYDLIQKIAKRLPRWQRNFLTYPGREILINYVLSAMPAYFLTVFKMLKWGLNRIDRYRRGFLWKGKDHDKVRGGHCLVKWQKCTRPWSLSGLGIKYL
jgi:hypothetical protein